MIKDTIIQKVLIKLSKKTEKETDSILFKYIDKTDLSKKNYKKTMKIDEQQHTELRSLYDKAPIEQLYTYGLGRFGFKYEEFKFDVTPNNLEINKE